MKLSLHTVICCCVFTTVLPPVRGATVEPNATLRKRYRAWLQSQVRRDPPNSSMPTNVQTANILDGPWQDLGALPSPPNFGLNERLRRSSSKQTRCLLATCLYHEMVHILHEMSKPKASVAPQEKISSKGYGRRRRSLEDTIQLALQTGKERGSSEAASKVSLAAETEDSS